MGLLDYFNRGRAAVASAAAATVNVTRQLGRDMSELMTGENSKPLWPSEADQKRWAGYDLHQALYEGKHDQVYGDGEGQPACLRYKVDATLPYLMTNMCGRLSNLLASRTFGEPYTVAAPDSEWATGELLAHITQENALQDVMARLAVEGSWRGRTCLRVTYHGGDDPARRRIEVSDVDPKHVFPEYDPLDTRRLVAVNIDQVVMQGKQAYLWRERHELREDGAWVLNKLYALDADEGGKWHVDFATDERDLSLVPALANKLPEVATGINDLLVVLIDGQTDYTDALKSLQGEYNNRLTQRMKVLNCHVSPTKYGPELPVTAINADGSVDTEQLGYIAVKDGAQLPGTITWDGQLGPSENELKELKVDFALSAGVDATALFPEQGQAVASGKALRIQQMTTQGTVLLRHPAWRAALQRVYSICSKLAAAKDGNAPRFPLAWQPTPAEKQEGNLEFVALDVQQITIGFGDGLPPDREADVKEELDRLEAGAQTLEAALEKLDGLGQAEAAEKAAAIVQAAAAGRPAPPTVSLTSPFALPVATGEE